MMIWVLVTIPCQHMSKQDVKNWWNISKLLQIMNNMNATSIFWVHYNYKIVPNIPLMPNKIAKLLMWIRVQILVIWDRVMEYKFSQSVCINKSTDNLMKQPKRYREIKITQKQINTLHKYKQTVYFSQSRIF